jgi:porin
MNIIPRKTAIGSAIAIATLGLLAAHGASAGELSTSPWLFGDWNGTRTTLAQQGVKFNFGHTSEIAGNASGGSAEKTRYSDQWVLGSDLDLGKLWGWNGASLNLTVTNRNGKNLGSDAQLGTFQQVQEVYGRGQTWRLTNLSIAQSLLDGRLLLKAGRLNIGSDFAGFSCDFQNLSFCGSQPGNLVGSYWGNWPVSVWAGVASYATSAHGYVKLGVYQVNPAYMDDGYNVRKGLHPNNPHGTTGALIPLEFGTTPNLRGLPGSYKIGAWYNTSDSADLMLDQDRRPLGSTSVGALERNGAYGGYINFQQQVSGVAGGKGATVFLNASQADKFTAATDSQVAIGMEYKGAFGRAADMIGVAIGATHANGRFAHYQRTWNSSHPQAETVVNDGREVAAEVFYSWSPVPSVSIRPNLQFIKHPGGSAQNSDVVVFGLKSSVAF